MTGSQDQRASSRSGGRTAGAVLLAAALGGAPLVASLPGLLAHLFTPAPIVWLVWRGERRGAALAGAGVLGASLLGGPAYLAQVVEFIAPMTLALVRAVSSRWSVSRALLVATTATVAVGIVGLVSQGGNPVEAAREQARQAGEMLAAVLAREAGEAVDAAAVARWLFRLQPALVLTVVATVAWLNLAIVRRVALGWAPVDLGAAASNEDEPPFDAWYEWRAPEPLVFVLILGGLALLPGHEVATAVGLNVLIVVGLVYLWQGLAVVGFVFRVRRVPMPFRGAGYALVALHPAVAALVGAFGLADLWVDFRRRARRAAGRATDDADHGG